MCIFQVTQLKNTRRGKKKSQIPGFKSSGLDCTYILYMSMYNVCGYIIAYKCVIPSQRMYRYPSPDTSWPQPLQFTRRAIYWKARGKPFSFKKTLRIVTTLLKCGMYSTAIYGKRRRRCIKLCVTTAASSVFLKCIIFHFFFSRLNNIISYMPGRNTTSIRGNNNNDNNINI